MLRSTWGPPVNPPYLRSKETVVARRAYPPRQMLEVRIVFEPGHNSPACVVQAYDWVVPSRHRTTPSQTLPTMQAGQFSLSNL